jgi:hypothetical protein
LETPPPSSVLPSNAQPSDNQGGAKDLFNRIENLHRAITKARSIIRIAKKESLNTLILWSFITVLILYGCIIVACVFYNDQFAKLPCVWTWQMIYYTAFRVAIITALFSLISFCFKMLRSSLYILEKYKHRYVVIESLASFVESSPTPGKQVWVFEKLLTIIVEFGDTGLLSKEDDIKVDWLDNIKTLKSVLDVFNKKSREENKEG